MPTSANITTSGVIAFTLPEGAFGVRVVNESDTTIRRLLGQPAGTSGASLGIPLASSASETLVFEQALKNPLAYCAIHAGTGDKTLSYEVITQPTLASSGPNSAAGGGLEPPIDIDCSANPNYPAASQGDRYRVIAPGKIGGASGVVVENGDIAEALADNPGGTQAAVGTSWMILQANIAGVTAAGLAMIQAADAAAQRTLLGLGTMATQAASAVAITGGTATGLTSLGIRNAGTGAFDLTLAHNGTLTAGRSLTFDMGDTNRTITLSGNLTVPATGTAALLGTAQTFEAAQTISVNGAASTPALRSTGTIFTGGSSTTTKPHWLIEPAGTTSTAWSTSGTLLGGNAPSGFVGNLFDFQINGTSRVRYEISTSRLFVAVGSTDAGALFGNNFAILGARGTALRSDLQMMWASSTDPTSGWDTGFARGSAGVVKVTNGSTGYGVLDASGFRVSGTAGATGGTFTAITSITVTNGIITAISGT